MRCMTTIQKDPCYVFGLVLDGEGGAREVVETVETVETVDANWLHIDYSIDSAEQWLQSRGLDEWVVSTLVRSDTRPRTVVTKTGVLIVLRAINLNPHSDPEDMVSLRIWLEADRIITVRQRRLFSVQDTKLELEQGMGATSVRDVMISIVEKIGDRISAFVDELEEQLEGIEELVEADPNAKIRSEISNNRRKVASVRRFLAPQRDALENLYRHAATSMEIAEANVLREQADRIVRYIEDLDLLRERLLVLQEETMNRMMEQQNSRMYALSIVAVIFLPITFVSGLFGMNVAGLPGTENPQAFGIVSVGMLAVTGLVFVLLMIKRWL
jgi:zinc transporter